MVQVRLEGGRELLYGYKQGTESQPLIAIITSTFNAAKDLHWTINSIRSQTYANIQWIIADGGSTDDTVEILKQNEDVIDYWFSESDEGIYDAWNKALKYVKGEWVQFIGAGDELASSKMMCDASFYLVGAYPKYELVYGNIQIVSEVNHDLIEEIVIPWGNMKNRWQGGRLMLPMHPEVFHHKSVFYKYNQFNTCFKIAADSYLLMQSIMSQSPLYIDLLIDKMVLGGVSSDFKNIYRVHCEIKKINKILDISPPFFHSLIESLKVYLKILLYIFIPKKYIYKVIDFLRVLLRKNKKWTVK
ncbi:glycosyltransferase family 2 protein [Celerinatantimonas yamalensis]|uniref:Glycosyltransferase family 2 protein n=1 Tax=Celerinatantimonas yamalensis TaxID=559956 RepID=A0ABW9G4N0_9GAMM